MSDKIPNPIEVVIDKGWDDLTPTGRLLKQAKEELTRLRKIEAAAKAVVGNYEFSIDNRLLAPSILKLAEALGETE